MERGWRFGQASFADTPRFSCRNRLPVGAPSPAYREGQQGERANTPEQGTEAYADQLSLKGRMGMTGRLDPEDWEAFRQLAHRMADDLTEHLKTIAAKPPAVPLEPTDVSAFQEPLPWTGVGWEGAYDQFRRHILANHTLNLHPRFWGWVVGTGHAGALLSEMAVGALNAAASEGDVASVWVEQQVLDWLKHLLQYPRSASGLLVSGASMGNLLGLAVARNSRAPGDVRRGGIPALAAPLVVYASEERHSSVDKAVELLGLGRDNLRLIAVDALYRIDPSALRRAIAEDRRAGRCPLAIVGSAGTVNTAAFDDLTALADVAAAEGLWLHVDGAFGALLAASAVYRDRVAGLDRADSVAFDLHKWLHMPYGVGCLLVRDAAAHRRAFALHPDYLDETALGPFAGPVRFDDYGIELSRPFRALHVWLSFRALGVEPFVAAIEGNMRQAAHLAERVDQEPRLERLAPVSGNIVCFRYVGNLTREQDREAVNQRLVLALALAGVGVVSDTRLGPTRALRVSLTNHRTTTADLDALVQETVRWGDRLASALELNSGSA
jgi:aromatic-L-amino-acid decarboxylase